MHQRSSFLPDLHPQVWWQVLGRGFYQTGHGLLQFYLPIVFVNSVGLSATAVGASMGSASLAGIVGHFLGGTLADSRVGRKGTLLLAVLLSAIAAIVLVMAHHLPALVAANLLLGLSTGCYWTATDTAIMDLTSTTERHQVFAVLGVADSIGIGVGIWMGSILLTLLDQAQHLFAVNGAIFLLFLVIIQVAIAETRTQSDENADMIQGWLTALRDRSLWVFVAVNSLFTTYIAVTTSILPLYFTNFLSLDGAGNTTSSTAQLFSWGYIGLGALLQVPVVRSLGPLGWGRALMVSIGLWGTGFLLVWLLGAAVSVPITHAVAVLAVLAIASVIYKPFAATFLSELAPESLRGVYAAIGYQCWTIGYLIGPTLGGWALDQPPAVTHSAWLLGSASAGCGLVVLGWLAQRRSADAMV